MLMSRQLCRFNQCHFSFRDLGSTSQAQVTNRTGQRLDPLAHLIINLNSFQAYSNSSTSVMGRNKVNPPGNGPGSLYLHEGYLRVSVIRSNTPPTRCRTRKRLCRGLFLAFSSGCGEPPRSIVRDLELHNDNMLEGLLSWRVEFSFARAILIVAASGTKW